MTSFSTRLELCGGRFRLIITAALLLGLSVHSLKADSTWVWAVQICARVQTSPPEIALTWLPDMYGASNYMVFRKAKEDTSWGEPLATLGGTITNFTDTAVTAGMAYEYAVVQNSSFPGYGYIFAGIDAPLTEARGKLILVVETNATASLAYELERLQTDLVGDGWQVLRHGVSSNDTPASVKSLIVADYYSDPGNVKMVFLFGHVPILQSGNLDYDGHGARPMPADAYYGDIDGDWSGSPGFLPSDVELMVGRVDLADLPGNAAPGTFPSETAMLRNYLDKDHNWRCKLITVERHALIADRFGDSNGENRASTAYRNFEPFVGHGNIVMADVSDTSFPSNRWISLLTTGNYLWTYAYGGGFDTGISSMGLHGQYNDVWSTDIAGQDAKAVFFMLEGSHFGNWDVTDNVIRSCLATPTMGLAVCCIAGHPHWFMHHMGLGETIGYGTRLTMNNSTLYQSHSNLFTRAIYIALMGDPALRMEPVAMPSGLVPAAGPAGVTLNWSPSADSVMGYNVYRAAAASGPFARLNGSLISGLSFTDPSPPAGNSTYMVRAVALQTNPSGSYFNPSQGAFASVNVNSSVPPITVSASLMAAGLRLSWNSQSGTVYHVLAATNLAQTNWVNVSGAITATGASSSWTDTFSLPQRFYRLTSP